MTRRHERESFIHKDLGRNGRVVLVPFNVSVGAFGRGDAALGGVCASVFWVLSIIEPESAVRKVQQFHSIAPFVDEQEQAPVDRIGLKLFASKAVQLQRSPQFGDPLHDLLHLAIGERDAIEPVDTFVVLKVDRGPVV